MGTVIMTGQLYVDGGWVDASSDLSEAVLNPATEEVLADIPQGSVADARRAIDAARQAFDEGPWPRMSVRERADVMLRMGEVMRRRAPEIVELNVAEAGSVRWQAEMIHTRFPIDYWFDLVERLLPRFAFEEPMLPHGGYGMTQGVVAREPVGVASLITAYNFPFMLNMVKVAPALAAGCTVVLKPSPYTPLEALILGEIADEAELPRGVLNVVTGGVDVGTELSTNPKVDLVSFTGSDVVGRQIYKQASDSLKKVVLELGGKSANIVCADADLDQAVADVVFNTTIQAGQGCSLMTRTLVERPVYDELLARVKAALDALKVGDPADPTVTMGPLIREAQRRKVESLISTGIADGAEVAYGGGRPAGLDKGYFVEPTVFTNVDNAAAIAQTEFFGPVGIVTPFDTEDEAIRLANGNVYGLGGGVWSANAEKAYAIAKRIRTGMVIVNGQGGFNFDVTFGGYGHSGLGRERGAAGISEYLEYKSIVWPVG